MKTNNKVYELYPGIEVMDANNLPYNQEKRLDVSMFKQFKMKYYENGYPDQVVRDKLAKNRSWSVVKSWSDKNNKIMYFDVVINAKTTEIKTLDYATVCKDFNWKSFKWSEDGQMILPKL